MEPVWPTPCHVPGEVDALACGGSPDGITVVRCQRRLGRVGPATDVDGLALQRVSPGSGGVLVERIVEPAPGGGGQSLRHRIDLR